MKIKEQTRKLAAGCSKHCFEVVDKTDEVSSKHGIEVADKTDEVSSKHCFEVADKTDEVSNHTYDKAKLTRFEEIFEEYEIELLIKKLHTPDVYRAMGALFNIEFLVFQDNFTYARKFLEFFKFFWMSDESDNITFLAHTASTSSTVSVGFDIYWDIKVYDTF
ncbi:chlorohydrolase [Streptococcus pseudopneumoniae 5247]|nr:chlorohydrolase [Streptococcus pseudopneumoniae 5247]